MSSRKILYGVALLIIFAASALALERANPRIAGAAGLENGQTHFFGEQPYPVNSNSTLLLDIDYAGGQNTALTLEPLQQQFPPGIKTSITHVKIAALPDEAAPPAQDLNTVSSGEEMTLDLSPYLHAGITRLSVQVQSSDPIATLYVNPKLFGTHLLSTLACVGLFIAAAGVLFSLALEVGLSVKTSLLAIAGMGYYALWLHLRPNLIYTADVEGHLGYILYMAHHWMQPYDYTGWENHQPPLYYFLAGQLFRLFNACVIGPLLAVRAFSLTLYMLFCLAGLRTLRDAVKTDGLAYDMGCLLILFWPAGITLATNISNDIPIYAVWGIAFYFLVRGLSEHRISWLQLAILLTGLAFMIKSTAIILAAMVDSCMLWALAHRQMPWRQMLQGRSLAACGLLLLGILINLRRIIYMQLVGDHATPVNYFGGIYSDNYPLSYFARFDVADFVARPYLTFLNEPGFWNYFLKTMLHASWNHPAMISYLPAAINLLLVVFLAVTLCVTALSLACRRDHLGDLLPFLLGVLIPLAGIMLFTMVVKYEFCQNLRFVVPMIVPLVVLFVRGIENARTIPLARPLYWLGIAAGTALPAAAAILQLTQY